MCGFKFEDYFCRSVNDTDAVQDCWYSRYLEQPSISMFVLPVHILNWHFPQCYCY